MYIKKQIDKILKEVDKIISKNSFTRIELLKVNELLKAMYKEV